MNSPKIPWYKTNWGLAVLIGVPVFFLGLLLGMGILLAVFLEAQGPKTIVSPRKIEKPKEEKEEKPKKEENLFKVGRVIDGDTIELANGERVRYIGINTPEKGQPFANEATAKNKELVEDKEVRLVKDVSERDKYGRLLRYVYVGDLFVNAELVKQGYANAATYPPDVKYSALFVKLEREAREANRGLWAPPPPTAQPQPAPQPSGRFVGNKNSGKLHNLAHPSCQNYVNMMNESNKVFFSSQQEAVNAGYYPCKKCY